MLFGRFAGSLVSTLYQSDLISRKNLRADLTRAFCEVSVEVCRYGNSRVPHPPADAVERLALREQPTRERVPAGVDVQTLGQRGHLAHLSEHLVNLSLAPPTPLTARTRQW